MSKPFKYLLNDVVDIVKTNTGRSATSIKHHIIKYNSTEPDHEHRIKTNSTGSAYLYTDYLIGLVSQMYKDNDRVKKSGSTVAELTKMKIIKEKVSTASMAFYMKSGGIEPTMSLGQLYYNTDKAVGVLKLRQQHRESNAGEVTVKRQTILDMHKAGTKITAIAKELDLEYQDVYRHIKSPTLKTSLLRHPAKKIAQMKERMNTMNPFFLMAGRLTNDR